MGPNVRIRAMSAAPVAIVFASNANATFPPASRSAMIPDPTTAATSSSVPRHSAVRRLGRLGFTCFPDAVDFLLDGEFVKGGQRQAQQQGDSALKNHECIAECALYLFRRTGHCGRIGNPPMCGHRLSRPNRADLFRCAITNGEYKIHVRRTGLGEFIPVLTS